MDWPTRTSQTCLRPRIQMCRRRKRRTSRWPHLGLRTTSYGNQELILRLYTESENALSQSRAVHLRRPALAGSTFSKYPSTRTRNPPCAASKLTGSCVACDRTLTWLSVNSGHSSVSPARMEGWRGLKTSPSESIVPFVWHSARGSVFEIKGRNISRSPWKRSPEVTGALAQGWSRAAVCVCKAVDSGSGG